jgi:hypothetical protein
MKEFDPLVILAVFQEMLGFWLWVLLLLAIGGIVAFLALWIRERRLVSRRLVQSEAVGLLGGVLALVIMAQVSSSGFTDAGGPLDWLLVGVIYGIGFIGTVILVYALRGWWDQFRRQS